jgi:tRNA-splicing ligase RtcB
MSLKYHAQKVGSNHYVLPKTGSMRTDAHAFFSEALYDATEEAMWQQLAAGASYEGVTGAYLMPDAHSGYGVPVGCVIVTDDVIIQAGSGYDISCGVLYMRVPQLKAADVADWEKRARWVTAVEDRVATGVGSHRPRKMPRFSHRKAQDILRFGARPSAYRLTCASVSTSRSTRAPI